MNTALLIIDIQNDYFPGGKMELEGAIEASLQAKKILNYFRHQQNLVTHIQHIATRPNATFFLPNTEGVEIHTNVKPHSNEYVVEKNFPNSFKETPLFDVLKKHDIQHLVITGMMTHMCIDATTRAAFDLNFQCTVLHDACATKALAFNEHTVSAKDVHHAFLAALSVPYAKILSVSEFLTMHS